MAINESPSAVQIPESSIGAHEQPASNEDSAPVSRKNRVILVGIGGATCSGKTTLAKLLNRVLPNSLIVHEDDFAPPQEKIPMHPVYNVQDWDSPAGAIDWPRLVEFAKGVKETGVIPGDHQSHEWMNEQSQREFEERERIRQESQNGLDTFRTEKERQRDEVEAVIRKWSAVFQDLLRDRASHAEEKIVWGLVDGFLLYWNQDVIDQLDVHIFLRVPHDVLKKRRHERHGYHTAVQSDAEGSLWKDPPHYWEQIVYPAYVEAHQGLFEGGDVEHGKPKSSSESTPRVDDLLLIEGTEIGMAEMLDRCCKILEELVQRKRINI